MTKSENIYAARDYKPCKMCRNTASYGEVCVKCGKCGRLFTETGKMISGDKEEKK